MTIEFPAAVLGKAGEPLTVETVTLPSVPPPGEVLVRLEASGVCHSDYHVALGEWAAPMPMVLGHEGAGVVEAVGEGVRDLTVGDHVVLSWTPSCRRCKFCISGRPVLCDLVNQMSGQHLSFDGTTRLTRSTGEEMFSFVALGTFGQYVMAPESGAIRISNDAPFAQAALVGCAVTTGIGAVTNTAKLEPGSTALVIGCGGVGLNIVQGARLAGASQIIAVDRAPAKLEAARKFGATATVDSTDTDVLEVVNDLTGGAGVDYAFEAIGLAPTIELCYEAIARGGTVVVAGQVAEGVKISLDPFIMSDQEKKVIGSNYGSSRPPIDFPKIIDLYLAGAVDLDSLVTDRIGLDQVNDAFAAMQRGEGIRSVIEY
ncbi:Zn-dependent alcohol dehydrogenase [Mycobacterium sp. ACS4331]|uniref:Zn-dependent alcohol dehydrogenase n=1 Tax=Mycobacterium sp. ACS4331 TaxID=1834121 RepID=UPI0007FCB9C7|nr:Zn-dependent alcohol dehydrogenase [Mycobacterium sp. ACS4331]OBF16753.1 dehydrogenase [Mycobacterium sp. ACS4331]